MTKTTRQANTRTAREVAIEARRAAKFEASLPSMEQIHERAAVRRQIRELQAQLKETFSTETVAKLDEAIATWRAMAV